MTKTSKANTGTTIDALVKEGKALAAIWKQTNSLKDTIKPNGFDTRLGKLLQQLKAASSLDSGQISRQVLTAHGIHTIDRRRRAEALWFVENEKECRAFIEAKGFKGSSLTVLQRTMNAEKKPAAKAEVSNVGQSEEASEPSASKPVSKPMSRTEMLDTILKACKAYGHNPEDIANDILAHISKGNAKVQFNTKVSKPKSKAAKAA